MVGDETGPATAVPPDDAGFRVVGIGASAGGLEAFEAFFHHLPPDLGVAFVLVPHLDPDHVSLLSEILQRATIMPVVEAQDHTALAVNQVYVIPPNREMAIANATLQLSVPDLPRGRRMPINAFFASLAADLGPRAIGIVLSGTGRDGTEGLGEILKAGGTTLVQEPATARYDGMPASAIAAGHATFIVPVEDMAVLLAEESTVRRAPSQVLAPVPMSPGGLSRLLMLLRSTTGQDFSLYKKTTITRRVERRMVLHDIADIELYIRFVKDHPAEAQALVREFLIRVTSFFRDPEAFAALGTNFLPDLVGAKPEGGIFRAWVASCATGEEAYSIAMLVREAMHEARRDLKVQIYATDLDSDSIAMARTGAYPAAIREDVTPERLNRFFFETESGYRIKKEIREMVVFAVHNVIKDPPFTRLDLLSCRNLMIYLDPELQARLVAAFHYALSSGGLLFLSPSESISSHPELFNPLDRKWKIYRAAPARMTAALTAGLYWVGEGGGRVQLETTQYSRESNFADLSRRALLRSYAPASVLADAKGNILYVHGETGKFLRPAPGHASFNVIDMARDGLQQELRLALHLATSKGTPTVRRDVQLGTNGNVETISFSLRLLPESDAQQILLLVSFHDAGVLGALKPPRRRRRATGSVSAARVEELERDLVYTRENLQSTIEQQQAYNEELSSANEELQSTNEELQSVNEELETSKEELQSLNEELITVNSELQANNDQLAHMHNDMKNLLDNTAVATLFLDRYLFIRRFTREANKIYRLVDTDVGRPLADIKSGLLNDDLSREALIVLDTLVPFEREVHTETGTYLARIHPYRTLDNVIEGVVLTFTDIAKLITAEAEMRRARRLGERIIDTVREPLVVLDPEMVIVLASRSFYQFFRTTPQATVGLAIYALGNRQWDIPELHELLEKVLPEHKSFDGLSVVQDFPELGPRRMLLNASCVVSDKDETDFILLAMEDRGPP